MMRKYLLTSILLVSTVQLYLSLFLTRFFSISQGYHWAFLVIGLALLGSGASGSFLYIVKYSISNSIKIIRISSFLLPLSIFLSYAINNIIPFDPYLIPWYPQQIFLWVINFLSLLIPFFLIGLIIVLSLTLFPEISEQIYGLTFIGGSIGILILNFSLSIFSEYHALILSIFLSLIAFIILSWKDKSLRILGFITILAFFTISITTEIPIKFSPYKDIEQIKRYPNTKIISTKRNAYSRIDIIENPSLRYAPGLSYRFTGDIPHGLGFTIDGENMKGIIKENGFTTYLPQAGFFYILKNPKVLIIEPGGGLDIVLSIEKKAKEITSVTENPFIAEILQKNFKNIKTILENPRVFLKRTKEKYDLIIFSLQESFHVVTVGTYSLNENYLLTKEAIKSAFSLLKEDGILGFTRWLQRPPTEELRLLITIYYALKELGIRDIERHILIYRSLNTMSFLVKRSPFTHYDINKIKNFLEEKAFDLVFYFNIKEEETNKFCILPEDIYFKNITGFLKEREIFIEKYPFEISPSSDDKPFFFHFFKTSHIPEILRNWGKIWLPFGGAGFLIVWLILFFVFIISFALIFLPLLRQKRLRFDKKLIKFYFYFTLIGLSYLFLEISLMQKFILYLGKPIYSFSTILFSILFFSGIGSFLSKRIKILFPYPIALLAIFIILLPFILNPLIENTLSLPFFFRTLISIGIIGFLGLLMGMPFPLGLELAKGYNPDVISWIYAINGFSSVISSFSSPLISISYGFNNTILLSGIFYLFSSFLFLSYQRNKQYST